MELHNDLTNWIKDFKLIDEAKLHEFPEEMFLIELYHFVPEIEEKGFDFKDIDGNSLVSKQKEVLLPIAKVLAGYSLKEGFYSKLKPGDIVSIKDSIQDIKRNPQWDIHQEAMKERPKPDLPQVPKYIGEILSWAQYRYDLNKVDSSDFKLIFLVPNVFLKSRLKPEYFDRFKVNKLEVVQA